MAAKNKYNFRLSDEAKRLLEKMSTNMGIPQTNILELAIREKAERMNVTLPPGDLLRRPPAPNAGQKE